MSNQQTTPKEGPALSLSKGTILIVDDTTANLRLLSQMLAKRGYKVRAVNSGARALVAIRANPPDLILLDIKMPEMNGYEVCERLKADEQSRDIPIIFISALATTEDKATAFAAGGVDYVTKPFQAEEVLARVETHLALRNLQKSRQQEIAELEAYEQTIAHDLKNSLNTITVYAELLALDYETISKEELRESAQSIAQGARKMADIINNLPLLAKTRKADVEIELIS